MTKTERDNAKALRELLRMSEREAAEGKTMTRDELIKEIK